MPANRKKGYDDDDDNPHCRRQLPFDDFFGFNFDEDIRRIHKHLNEIMESGFDNPMQEPAGRRKPFVYGFTVKVGPDGQPKMERFGNIHRPIGPSVKQVVTRERNPLTDVIDSDCDISITMELPGVEKKDIDLKVTEDSANIHVETQERKYFKEIDLPASVIPESTKATYKNGVLDISIKKMAEKHKKGRTIKID